MPYLENPSLYLDFMVCYFSDMYIDYEKIGKFLGFGKDFFYIKKIEQNCAYIKKNIKKVKQKLKNKHPLKVIFYVYDSSRWKSQSVYDLMVKDERFEPVIVVTKNYSDKDNMNYQSIDDIKKNYEFFKSLGMNVEYGYDLEKDDFIPFETFNPDLIFYSHPWYVYKTQGPVVCSKFALTYYVPYFISDTNEFFEYDLRFHRYLYRHYVPNDIIRKNYASKMPNKGVNLVTVGHPHLDYFYLDKKEHEKKYLIYAPHWSVCGNNIRYSTFDWSGYEILQFAQKHTELNWVFKPHPALYRSLFTSGYMTQKQADDYFNTWKEIGQIYDTGDYLDLFMKSYAMITDSGSFLNEYLLTKQPLIHLVSEKFIGNESVREICKGYYDAFNIEDLNKCMDEIIIKRNDPKKEYRLNLIKELRLDNNFCAQNIIKDIISDL